MWVYQIIWKWVSQAQNLTMSEKLNAGNMKLGDVGLQALDQPRMMKNLKSWSIFTSNVDGQFQKYGFDEARIVEGHGNFHFLQCSKRCSDDVWPISKSVNSSSREGLVSPFLKDICAKTRSPTDAFVLAKDDAITDEVEESSTDTNCVSRTNGFGEEYQFYRWGHRALPQKTNREKKIENYLPRCRNCGEIARPTVNMGSGDSEDHLWIPSRKELQLENFRADLEKVARADSKTNVVVLEIGAGKNCDSVSKFSENLLMSKHDGNIDTTLIRINSVAEDQVPSMESSLQENSDVISIDGSGVFEPLLMIDRAIPQIAAYHDTVRELEEHMQRKMAEHYQAEHSVDTKRFA